MNKPLTLTADRSLIRAAGASKRYLLAEIEAPLLELERPRLPLNIALVIDRSGSMSGAKIEQVRQAALYSLDQLEHGDRIAVVVYDDKIDVLLSSTAVTPDALEAARARIRTLEARGTTDLASGWLTGCREVAHYLDHESIARCLLLTDGLANRGITDHRELIRHASELRARGVATSTFGVGNDFDEVLLSALAEAGGGTYRLIRDAEEIPGLIREELKEGLEVAVARARLEVRAPKGAKVSSLNDFPVSVAANGATHIDLGDLVGGQVLHPVLCVEFPHGERGAAVEVEVLLRDGVDSTALGEARARFEYAGHTANSAQPRERRVDREVATIFAARARRRALTSNRDGDFRGAEQIINSCAQRIHRYAGDDPELKCIVADLADEKRRYARDMDVRSRKAAYSSSMSTLKFRSSSGASIRRSGVKSVVVVPCSTRSEQAARIAVDELQRAGVQALGNLRVARRWRALDASLPQSLLEPMDEIMLVDAALDYWPNEGLRIILTDARLPDNGFSRWHAVGRTAMVSLDSMDKLIRVDLAAYVGCEILLNGLNNASPRYDALGLAHDETRGCLFDRCADKRHLEIKLQNLHVCQPCADKLGFLHIDLEELARATDAVRDLARPVVVA